MAFKHVECTPGYSTFVPQVAEAGWASDDILFGPTKNALAQSMFVNTQRSMHLRHSEEAFENVLHAPGGINAHQGDLIRGEGRWEPTGCVHDFGFRRFTSQKLEALDRSVVAPVDSSRHGFWQAALKLHLMRL